MLAVTEEIVKRLRSLKCFLNIKEVVLKDIDELEDVYSYFEEESVELIQKNPSKRKYGESFSVDGVNFSCESMEDLAKQLEEKIVQVDRLVSVIRELARMYRVDQDIIDKTFREIGI